MLEMLRACDEVNLAKKNFVDRVQIGKAQTAQPQNFQVSEIIPQTKLAYRTNNENDVLPGVLRGTYSSSDRYLFDSHE